MINLQLDVPALERLIGDDKEFQVRLKDGVILNFIDKHLRILLKDELIKAKIEEITKKIDSEADKIIAKEIGTIGTGFPYSFTLKPDLKSHITSLITLQINEMIRKSIIVKVDEAILKVDIGTYAERIMKLHINELSKKAIDEKAKELIAKALK